MSAQFRPVMGNVYTATEAGFQEMQAGAKQGQSFVKLLSLAQVLQWGPLAKVMREKWTADRVKVDRIDGSTASGSAYDFGFKALTVKGQDAGASDTHSLDATDAPKLGYTLAYQFRRLGVLSDLITGMMDTIVVPLASMLETMSSKEFLELILPEGEEDFTKIFLVQAMTGQSLLTQGASTALPALNN